MDGGCGREQVHRVGVVEIDVRETCCTGLMTAVYRTTTMTDRCGGAQLQLLWVSVKVKVACIRCWRAN